METLKAQGKFHAAHRQLGYDGKCAYVHGHTWRGTFVVRARRFPRDEKLDMSVDFGAFKAIFKFLDHKMLVSERDEFFLNSDLFEPEGVVVMPGRNPSVENVALYGMNQVIDILAKHFQKRDIAYHIEVVIQETENNVFTLEKTITI